MRHITQTTLGIVSAMVLIGGLSLSPNGWAEAELPSSAVCDNKATPPTDAATLGGCVVLDRKKGNCLACHSIAGGSLPGNIAPPLVALQTRFPDKEKLRRQIWDATEFNPQTSMPPFGRHQILTEEEIDQVLAFLLTL